MGREILAQGCVCSKRRLLSDFCKGPIGSYWGSRDRGAQKGRGWGQGQPCRSVNWERKGGFREERYDCHHKRRRLSGKRSPDNHLTIFFFQNFLLQFYKVLNLHMLKFQLILKYVNSKYFKSFIIFKI